MRNHTPLSSKILTAIAIALLSAASETTSFASVFDARTTAILAADAAKARRANTRSTAVTPTLYYPVIIEIDDDSALNALTHSEP